MKVILNEDVKHLGELGDVKEVAAGYARNYLFPRNLALPCNDQTMAFFESRKAEIEEKKAQKRKDSASLKEKLESASIALTMPCGKNGKLYGAVTNQTIVDELTKQGFTVERKRIEIPGLTIKSTGNYTITIRLYEAEVASLLIHVKGQEDEKSATDTASKKVDAKAEVAAPTAEATDAE